MDYSVITVLPFSPIKNYGVKRDNETWKVYIPVTYIKPSRSCSRKKTIPDLADRLPDLVRSLLEFLNSNSYF